MHKRIIIPCYTALVAAAIAMLCLLYVFSKVNTDVISILNRQQSGMGVGLGYLFVLLFHIIAFVYILMHFKSSQDGRLFAVLTLLAGIVSFFALGAEKVFYDEIAHQSRDGMPFAGEQTGVTVSLAIHMVFAAMVLVLSIKTILASQNSVTQIQARDDRIFTMAQWMGIISGSAGIGLTLSLINRQIPADRLWIHLPFYLLMLIPYAITALYWLSLKMKQNITDWYDEKQVADMSKAAMAALLLSVPGLALLLLIDKPILFYYVPFYVFLILFLFSAGTLYFFKKK